MWVQLLNMYKGMAVADAVRCLAIVLLDLKYEIYDSVCERTH